VVGEWVVPHAGEVRGAIRKAVARTGNDANGS
jgi:hypothetical protein